MKLTLITLAAASSALLSTPALADVSPYARAWITETTEEISQQVRPTPGTSMVAIRARIGSGGDRWFKSAEVIGTSGSRAQDAAALRAVRKFRMSLPPAELQGRRLTLRIRPYEAPAEADGAATLR